MTDPRQRLIARAIEGYDPEVGAALWRLQDARGRTLRSLRAIPAEHIGQELSGNSIGTILYHVALIEADWLYSEILEKPIPADVQELLPLDDRDSAGILSRFGGDDLDAHLARLSFIRERLMAALVPMTPEDLHRPRELKNYDVCAAWVLHHLAQHEAEHRGELESVAARLRSSS